MNSKILLLLIFAITIVGCDTRSKFAQKLEKNHDVYQYKWTVTELGRLVDTTFIDSTNLNSILDFKMIDLEGNVKSVDMEIAIKQYISNIESEKPKLYPIFEIKNTSKVILPVFGQGLWDRIWGKVVLDKKTMKVLKIKFNHSEAPGLGGNINDSTFSHQFKGSTINIANSNYSLYQSGKEVIQGNQRIDGVSGATMTSKGVIEMLNNDLMKYEKYLR
jgi:Na+-transporting NADH:ubiquinone oxidoreductase subunit C